MRIQILIDNTSSWIIPFTKQWIQALNSENISCNLLHNQSEVTEGEILCLLGCEKKYLSLHLNKYNLVVHESDLPTGRGMSPMTWQILEGNNEIVVSLLEATDEIDAGLVYYKEIIKLTGNELAEDWRKLQAEATFKLLNQFIKNFPYNIGNIQNGEATYYPKRNSNDSKMDIHKTIAEQFNLLRVVDNERYPAWFEINGVYYELKIMKKHK
jgi:methionyl-tRNA formyltransferase